MSAITAYKRAQRATGRLMGPVGFLALLAASTLNGAAEDMQFGLSTEEILITSDFSGAALIVFGTIEDPDISILAAGGYQVAVVAESPREEVVIRRKERILGIWVNKEQRRFRNVPKFYSVAAKIAPADIAERSELKRHELGIANLDFKLFSSGNETFILPEPEFSTSLKRLRQNKQLYAEEAGSLNYLSPTLFRARLWLPAAVPVGELNVTAYLFREGEFVTSRSDSLRVRKAGIEQWVFELAHEQPLAYGLIAVILAIATGWIAGVVFRKE